MWNDNWAHWGPLFDHLTLRSLYNARLDINISVAEMIQHGVWKWPDDWGIKFPTIVNIPVPVPALNGSYTSNHFHACS